MLELVQNTFHLNLWFLNICGLYVRGKPTVGYKIRGLLFLFFCVTPITLATILYYLLHQNFDIEDVKYDASFHAHLTCCFFKYIFFITKKNRISKCIRFLDRYKFSFITKTQEEILEKAAAESKRNTSAFLICCVAGVLAYAIKPLFGKEIKLPSQVWLPFHVASGSLGFYIVYWYMAITVIFLGIGVGFIDPLMAGLAHFASSHIKILNDQLENLDLCVINEKVGNSSTPDDIIFNRINVLAIYHNVILDFVKEIEKCFSGSFFCQVSGSVFVICFVCVQLTENKTVDWYLFYILAAIVVVFAQITFLCYYGNELTEETNRITNSIYMGNWYSYKIKSRKSLMILMQRSQRPVIISAAKLLDLSLPTLAMIIRRSYSLLAVLKNH